MPSCNTGRKPFEGESEIFDAARSLVKIAETMFPKADKEELKRTCNAALNVAIHEAPLKRD